MAPPSPAELARQANGKMKAKNLTRTDGLILTYLYTQPLVDYLQANEQPQYILDNETYGIKITEPNGSVRTPHHDSSEGKRYLLVTDERILYVAGRPSGDESMTFDYDSISDISCSVGITMERLTFVDSGDTGYSFVSRKYHPQSADISAYVTQQLTTTLDHGSQSESSQGPSDPAPTPNATDTKVYAPGSAGGVESSDTNVYRHE